MDEIAKLWYNFLKNSETFFLLLFFIFFQGLSLQVLYPSWNAFLCSLVF